MQPLAQPEPSPASQSFAGRLEAIASPPRGNSGRDAIYDASGLGEDVATLSYERALRAHARYKPANRPDWLSMRAKQNDPGGRLESRALVRKEAGDALATQDVSLDRHLRTSSVTIRLNNAECARVHQLAAEAGLTVSAYLRSCTFEAEALRAQVKAALVELKETGTKGSRDKGNEEAPPREREGVLLTEVLGHIGKLWLGFSTGR